MLQGEFYPGGVPCLSTTISVLIFVQRLRDNAPFAIGTHRQARQGDHRHTAGYIAALGHAKRRYCPFCPPRPLVARLPDLKAVMDFPEALAEEGS